MLPLLSKNLVRLTLILEQFWLFFPVVFLNLIVLQKPVICFATESIS